MNLFRRGGTHVKRDAHSSQRFQAIEPWAFSDGNFGHSEQRQSYPSCPALNGYPEIRLLNLYTRHAGDTHDSESLLQSLYLAIISLVTGSDTYSV